MSAQSTSPPPPAPPTVPADFTLTHDNRVVAYVWVPTPAAPGQFWRGAREPEALGEVPWGDVVCIDGNWESTLLKLARSCPDYDAWGVSAGVEGLVVQDGNAQPNFRHRRF